MNIKYSQSYIDSETKTLDVDGTELTYRITGKEKDVPLICFNHLAGNLDAWDPAVIDGLAKDNMVITFNNRGIGTSGGETPKNVQDMAVDALDFIKTLGYSKIDILGFSLGGAIAQELTLKHPELVRKLILAGTGPAGGIGIKNIRGLAYKCQIKSLFTFTDIRTFLFFTKTENGKSEAKKFIQRVNQRKENRDKDISLKSFFAQLDAIDAYAKQEELFDFSGLDLPVLVANGEDDIMVPSINSAHLMLEIPNAKLVLYKDAGHGGVFQWHSEFVDKALDFLRIENA